MFLTTYFTLMGHDFTADIEFRVTYWGCEARTYGPPEDCYPAEAPEYEVESIGIALDEPGIDYPYHEATGAFLDSLIARFDDAICEAIVNHDPCFD